MLLIKFCLNSLVPVGLLLLIVGCGADEVATRQTPDETLVGFVQVDINATKPVVRGGESLFGNLVADAMYYHGNQQQLNIDAAIVNGGNLRFDGDARSDGIYPAGEVARDTIDEMLPFRNKAWVMRLNGGQLKSIFERSVHALPIPEGDSGSGAFLQVSSQLQLTFDLTQQAQLLDELVTPPEIAAQGERLQVVLLNGAAVLDDEIYSILVPEFIGGGGDGFIALGEVSASNITVTNFVTAEALENYLQTFSPVSPVIENRIELGAPSQ